MRPFGLTIFASAFLLFQVQPLMGRFVLPWFGGTPAVWTACMLFFQLLLLSTTNQICQAIAVVPFLWVAPLAGYLLTFVICLDRKHWYSPRWLSAWPA